MVKSKICVVYEYPRRIGANLMKELVEGVLSVGPGLPKDNLSSLVGQNCPIHCHALAITLHRDLLDMCCKTDKTLGIWKDRSCAVA